MQWTSVASWKVGWEYGSGKNPEVSLFSGSERNVVTGVATAALSKNIPGHVRWRLVTETVRVRRRGGDRTNFVHLEQ